MSWQHPIYPELALCGWKGVKYSLLCLQSTVPSIPYLHCTGCGRQHGDVTAIVGIAVHQETPTLQASSMRSGHMPYLPWQYALRLTLMQ